MLKNVYIAGGARTPFGSMNGCLTGFSAPQLGSLAIREALRRAKIGAQEVDEVFFGNVVGAGLGQNVARQASLGAGLGVEVGATTISKVCGSAMRSVIVASQAIQCGDAHLVVAGGCESMSNAPYLLSKARSGYRMGHGQLIDSMIHDGLWDVYTNQHMGHCGDLCSNKYGFSREAQDDYAIESYERALKAWEGGFFAGSVVPVEVESSAGTTLVERDEDVAKYRGAEKLRSLRPAFGPESSVTAGNASGVSDGAVALAVFDDEKKDELNIKPQARILGYANAALESDWFTVAPIHAITKLCKRLGIRPQDVDFFEINEAFAVVAMLAIRELGLDRDRVNTHGGAVALGHPIGATGARLINTLARTLERYDKKLGIACLCIGGGEADAIAIERCV